MGPLSIGMHLLKTREGVEQWLRHGKEALVANHGERAEWAFGNILQAQPDTPEALQGLLTSWLLQGKSDQVIEYHDESSEHTQEQLREYLWIALAMQVGHLSQEGYARWICLPARNPARLNSLQELSEAFPKCGALAMDWANAALASYQLDLAQKALKQLRDAQPRLPEREVARLHARRDAILLQEHPELSALLNEACQITAPLERFVRLEPVARRNMDVAALQREAGLALFEANRPEDAMRFLNRAVDINPYWVNAWIELGLAAKAAGRLLRSKEAFIRAFHLAPEPWLQSMQQTLETTLEENPHMPALETARDRMKVGDFTGAVLPLQKAIKASDEPDARWMLGESYFAQGEDQLACTYLRGVWADALEQGKQLTTAQLSLLELSTHQYAFRLLTQHKTDQALDLLDEMLSTGEYFDLLREDQWIARRLSQEEISLRACILYEKGRPRPSIPLEQSLALIDEAVKDSNHFPEALVARAVLASELGDLEAAHRDLKFSIGALEATAIGLFHLAGLAFLRQDMAMARALWQRCVTDGQTPWAQRSLANLNALSTQQPQDLYIAWLPTHQRIIEFTPSGAYSLDELPPVSKEDLVFEVSPSLELNAIAAPPNAEEIQALAEAEIPRFSDLVPDDAQQNPAPDPLAFLSQDMLTSVDPHQNEDDGSFFGLAKESNLPTFLLDEDAEIADHAGWDLGQQQVDDLLPALPENTPTAKEQVPLFQITEQQDLEAEYPLDLVEHAVQNIPRLSDVVPSTQGLDDFVSEGSLMDEKEEPLLTETGIESLMGPGGPPAFDNSPLNGPAQDHPLLSSDAPLSLFSDPFESSNADKHTEDQPPKSLAHHEAKATTDSSADLAVSLFGGEDDLSSFLDEAFMSLDNIEKK